MCMRDPGRPPQNPDEILEMKMEPMERGLQEHVDFLKDRAQMMRFLDKPCPPPDEKQVKSYYRLYWIEEFEYPNSGILFHSADNKK